MTVRIAVSYTHDRAWPFDRETDQITAGGDNGSALVDDFGPPSSGSRIIGRDPFAGTRPLRLHITVHS